MEGAVKKGQVLLITQGAYSSYSVCGILRVCSDFPLKEFEKMFEKSGCSNRFFYGDEFMDFLVAEGVCEKVDYTEEHYG